MIATAEVQFISDSVSCGRLGVPRRGCSGVDPQVSPEFCPIVALDSVLVTCSLDPSGGEGNRAITLPNGTSIPLDPDVDAYLLPDVSCSDVGLYTCSAENNAEMCISSSDTVMVPIYG